MKGVRSVVKKNSLKMKFSLCKSCHLANILDKSGMETLPVDMMN